jgi:hypothetical protein
MLDRKQIVRGTPGQVGGVATLGMHRGGGNDRTGDIGTVQQHREHRVSFVVAPTSTWPNRGP